ncbi:hypothetical protein CsSME_00017367 [Camellia sinensis var. sinensis]
MLFAKKGQRAVFRLVELPAAGDFLRAPQEKKEHPGLIYNEAKIFHLPMNWIRPDSINNGLEKGSVTWTPSPTQSNSGAFDQDVLASPVWALA